LYLLNVMRGEGRLETMVGRRKFLMAGAVGARPCFHGVFWERVRELPVTPDKLLGGTS
jgi:hypothetical protein